MILALAFAAFGLGRSLGPVAGSRLAGRVGIERSLIWSLLGLVGVLASTGLASLSIRAGTGSAPAVAVALGLITLLGFRASATI